MSYNCDMNRETFEKQKAFAGEKKPSMQRRCIDHDYTERRMYMITMVTEERKPLFGKVVGHSEAVAPSETTGTMLQKHYRQRSAD